MSFRHASHRAAPPRPATHRTATIGLEISVAPHRSAAHRSATQLNATSGN
jgi:hypothetical protein